MNKDDLKDRTKAFALRVIRLVESLPRKKSSDVLGKQLLRSATSMAANYRAALRARTKPEFISKLRIVEEEADESLFWIELLIESQLIPEPRLAALATEAHELTAIFTAAGKTARKNASGNAT